MNVISLHIDLARLALRQFMAAKDHKLPKDELELAQWLFEFSEEAWRITESWQRVAEEQATMGNRPIIIQRGELRT